MKITRTRLRLNSLAYSREFDVDRSTGIHLMQIVDFIGKTSGVEKKYNNSNDTDLEPFAAAGFIWEHCMSREEKLEHAMSVEALRMYMMPRANLVFPGELFWCKQCDTVMTGGKHAQEHCRSRKHRGIYFTPDAMDYVDDCYVEWKFTWKSSRRSDPLILETPKGIWRWPVQCAWNCFGLGTDKAKIIALHCNGDYSPGMPQPIPYKINIQFSQRELERNKMMIVTNAENEGWI